MKRLAMKIAHGFLYIFFVCLFHMLFPVSNLFCSRKKIWIITERGYDARDNGYHLFKFLKNNHPEINCYYTINKKSSDYKNIQNFKNVISHGSLKHIFLFSCAKAKISSTVNGFAPNKYYAKYMLKHHLQGLNVGIKHGIFKNIHPNYFKKNSHLDLLICGAQPEFEFVKSSFGFNEDEVAYCGLARFDNLHNNNEREQILLMPTFRNYLENLNDEEFMATKYFKKWDELLKKIDENIANETKVVFYIHAVFQKYVDIFENRYKNVVIAKFDEYDVQQLLKESKLLVTDFSSVFFDFAYMRKPLVFYQFDEDEYYSKHYQKAYFDYRRDGFGDVCIDSDLAIKSIYSVIDNKFKLDKKYLTNVEHFFPLFDNNNCERICERILAKL